MSPSSVLSVPRSRYRDSNGTPNTALQRTAPAVAELGVVRRRYAHPVKAKFLSIVLFIIASLAVGADKAPPELKPDTLRFVRTEQKTFPPIVRDGRTVTPSTTVTYGVFAFRYSHPKPLEFWGFGEPHNKKFTTRFTDYRIRRRSSWDRFPIGYCGTGATTYTLQPGVDYELLISISLRGLSDASQLRVSAESPDGTFWSEPFSYPTK